MLISHHHDPDEKTLTFFYAEPLTEDERAEAFDTIIATVEETSPPKGEIGELTIRWILRPDPPVLDANSLLLLPALKSAAVGRVECQRTPTSMHELVDFVSRLYHVPISLGSRAVMDVISEGRLVLNPDRTLDIPAPDPL